MTIASITTDIKFGPYIIPSNGQNMILNFYSNRKKLKIDLVIPEPIFSFKYETTRWLMNQFNITDVILCSFHQLPLNDEDINNLIDEMGDVNFHFAIEGVSGNLSRNINDWRFELNTFNKMHHLDGQKIGWSGLYDLMEIEYK